MVVAQPFLPLPPPPPPPPPPTPDPPPASPYPPSSLRCSPGQQQRVGAVDGDGYGGPRSGRGWLHSVRARPPSRAERADFKCCSSEVTQLQK